MKKRLGFIFCASGMMLMMQPEMDVEEISMFVNYVLVHYWPLALIVVGLSMMNKKQKPRRK